MSIGLLLPAALLALAALLVPLLVHLVRQSEQTRIHFAALRWLVSREQPRRRPRFNEWLLLALRLLLLVLVALWLAQPVLRGRPDTRPWLVVHPSIDLGRVPASSALDEQRHWLAPGFPPVTDPVPAFTTSLASLLRELDATLPAGAALRVVVPEQFDATDAQRAVLGRAIEWTPVAATSAFNTATASSLIHAAVYADATHRQSRPYLRAAATAWASSTSSAATNVLREINGPDALRREDTQLLWLASTAAPMKLRQWVHNGGITLLAQDSPDPDHDWSRAEVAWRANDGTPLALRMADGKGAWVRMLVPLDPQSVAGLLEPTFPDALQALLEAAAPNATRAWANAYEPIHADITRPPQPPRPLGTLLALLIALLFGIERWLATAPRRSVA